MLVLTRKREEALLIGDVRVQVLAIGKHRVKLGVSAPGDIPIEREEVADRYTIVPQPEEMAG